MDKKVIAAVIFVLVVGVVFGAYFLATPAPQIEQKQSEITVTDLAGRVVTLEVPVNKIVFVEGGHVGYIIALDAVGGEKALKKIVGMDMEEWKSIRQWIYSKYVEVYPWIKDIEDIGTSKALNVEKIIKLHPDVVLAPLYTKEDIPVEKLEAAGIPIIFIDYHAETIENHRKSTLILGTLVDQRDRAKALVDLYEERANMVSSRVAEVENKPKVYLEGGYRKWSTYGRYMWGEMVKNAGGTNIAWDLFERGGEISPEYVLKANPDVIVVTGSYWVKRPESIWLGYYAHQDLARERLKKWIERPGWSDINAVKNNRVYAIHHQLSRNIWDFIAVEYLAKCFYPDLFNDVDPVEDFKIFHDTFLSIDYAGVWMLSLEEEKKAITVTDLAGRQVTVKVPVERIILQSSGSGGAFYTLFALEGKDAPEKIVGWDPGLKKYRMWIFQKFIEACPELENIPNVGSAKDLSVEQVISLNPDVLIVPAYSWKSAKDVYDKVEQAGIPILTIDYHTETLETHRESIMLLGKVLGREEKAQELVDFYEEQVNEVYSRLDEIDEPKPKVYVELGMKGPSEYSNTYGDYMWGALIEKSGGINIAKGKIERWGPISPEYLLDANPDVIIITGSYWPGCPGSMRLGYYANPEESRELLKAFTERPGWDTLSAVNNNRVYSIHHGLARDIWDFVAIQYMAKCFYPDVFEDLNPEENFKEFHEKFLPVDYSGVWMLSLEE